MHINIIPSMYTRSLQIRLFREGRIERWGKMENKNILRTPSECGEGVR